MYCTAPDDKKHLQRFVQQTGTGGIWPKDFVRSGNYGMRQRLFLCFIFALTYILPFIFIWQFKFGDATVAIALLLLFVGLVGYVYRSMSLLLVTRVSGA